VVAAALARLGALHTLVLHGAVGMDEVSPSGPTLVWEVCDGTVAEWRIEPERYGLACADLDGLAGGEPSDNARRIERLLEDNAGVEAVRCAVLLNAAAALYVSGRGWTFEEAVDRATRSLESGAAAAALQRLRLASVPVEP
jgi:anthranilate phosphoribosyltransferase